MEGVIFINFVFKKYLNNFIKANKLISLNLLDTFFFITSVDTFLAFIVKFLVEN